MKLSKDQYRQIFSVIEEQLQAMSKAEIIENYFKLFYEKTSEQIETRAQRVAGAKKKNLESRELKRIFENICTQVLLQKIEAPKRLRFSDISKSLAKARPEIEWLGTGMRPVEANAKSQYKKSIRVNKWLTEFNNKYFASKDDISR